MRCFLLLILGMALALTLPAHAAPREGGTRLGSNIYDGGASGKVGIGTSDPQATLDINGTARLALNPIPPVPCDKPRRGTLALTHEAELCICNTDDKWTVIVTKGACPW